MGQIRPTQKTQGAPSRSEPTVAIRFPQVAGPVRTASNTLDGHSKTLRGLGAPAAKRSRLCSAILLRTPLRKRDHRSRMRQVSGPEADERKCHKQSGQGEHDSCAGGCGSPGQLYVSFMRRTHVAFLQQIRVVLLAVAIVFGPFGTAAQANGMHSVADMEMSFASAVFVADESEDCNGCSTGADMSSACHSAVGCQAAADLPDSGALRVDAASVAIAIPLDARARGLALRPLAQPPK